MFRRKYSKCGDLEMCQKSLRTLFYILLGKIQTAIAIIALVLNKNVVSLNLCVKYVEIRT